MSLGRPASRRALFAAGTALAALALSACGDGGTQGGGGNTNFVTGKSGIAISEKSERVAAPDIEGETLDGKKLKLSDYKGKVVVVNTWGSWCSPCRAEAKYLQRVSEATKSKGVQFLGINTRDAQKSSAIAFEEDQGITYPSLFDPAGKQILKFPKGSLSPQAIPTTIVIDRDGKIAARYLTALSDKRLYEMINPVLAEK
ncbi:TlpA family protein disulfide reductase [Streptomyces sp. TRM66268-LWL]|uniref:TlpA family protein disulfide reductase n=1 Tax=Streptomyces polyasparticus TaxID=2767826 RepID=A0ABR7SUU7_9ACTN|nr:TlpA disulfide reductase family protein [Streptomyces polyasparticus]MBC9718664.1 TlpA family protein disulfide reductase [Streptomyces polyasparticus]